MPLNKCLIVYIIIQFILVYLNQLFIRHVYTKFTFFAKKEKGKTINDYYQLQWLFKSTQEMSDVVNITSF